MKLQEEIQKEVEGFKRDDAKGKRIRYGIAILQAAKWNKVVMEMKNLGAETLYSKEARKVIDP